MWLMVRRQIHKSGSFFLRCYVGGKCLPHATEAHYNAVQQCCTALHNDLCMSVCTTLSTTLPYELVVEEECMAKGQSWRRSCLVKDDF